MKDSIKEDIIHTAKTFFYNEGYEETTIRLIAKKLGIYHSNILYYFKNKDSILKIIFEEYYAKMLELIYEINDNLPPTELILCTISTGINFSRYNKKFQLLYYKSTDIIIEILQQYALEYYPRLKEESSSIMKSHYLIYLAMLIHAEKEMHKLDTNPEFKINFSSTHQMTFDLFANVLELNKEDYNNAKQTAVSIARVIDYSKLNIFDDRYRIELPQT